MATAVFASSLKTIEPVCTIARLVLRLGPGWGGTGPPLMINANLPSTDLPLPCTVNVSILPDSSKH